MKNRPASRIRLFLGLVLMAPAFLVPHEGTASAGAHIEKTVDVPRDTKVQVALTHQRASIEWLESKNEPSVDAIARAEKENPKDKTWVLFRFYYQNPDYVGYKVQLRALLLDEDGAVLAEAGRRSTLDARQVDDTISFPMRIRLLDWRKARSVKILATFLN